MILTSDGSLRLFDVLAGEERHVERWRLRVVTQGAPPVAFAFGRGTGWDRLAVYVLTEDGKILVAAPVAPIGTRIATTVWKAMLDDVQAVIRTETAITTATTTTTHAPSNTSAANKQASRTTTPPRRLLDFSAADDFLHDGANARRDPHLHENEQQQPSTAAPESWALKQAHMQRRFLHHVFAPAADGHMVAVREFKPAPLLFQGPLYTEHDDLDDFIDDETLRPPSQAFVSLTILHCGDHTPPVLLRTAKSGDVSVLIAMEPVEAQWFISADEFTTSGEDLLEANDEYAQCARTVAPLLLCFEHLSFGGPVKLFPIGQRTDADVLYAVTNKSVFSVRLTFISALADAGTLESTPNTVVSQILSIWKPESADQGEGPDDGEILLGLAPFFARGQGPVALVLSSEGRLHVSDPLRWMTDFENAWPRSLLGTGPGSDATWKNERPLTGRGAFAFPESGKEMMELLHLIQSLQGTHGGRVAPGTLGTVSNIKTYVPVLEYLEKRVEVFTGGSEGPGIGDSFRTLADVLHHWSVDLQNRVCSHVDGVEDLQTELADVERSENNLRRKLMQVEEGNLALVERIRKMMKQIQQGTSELGSAERERYNKLKDKRRHLAGLKRRVDELQGAVQARKTMISSTQTENRLSTPARGLQSPYGTPGRTRMVPSPLSSSRRSKRWSASPSWRSRDSPLSQRRLESSPQSEHPDFTPSELKQIKEALEKQSADIGEAMDKSSKLWQRLSVS